MKCNLIPWISYTQRGTWIGRGCGKGTGRNQPRKGANQANIIPHAILLARKHACNLILNFATECANKDVDAYLVSYAIKLLAFAHIQHTAQKDFHGGKKV